MAIPFILSKSLVDTIICMEDTEVIGAYMVEELLENGSMVVNSDRDIHVVRPTSFYRWTIDFYAKYSKICLQ